MYPFTSLVSLQSGLALVTSSLGFPTPPFVARIGAETVTVSAVSGNGNVWWQTNAVAAHIPGEVVCLGGLAGSPVYAEFVGSRSRTAGGEPGAIMIYRIGGTTDDSLVDQLLSQIMPSSWCGLKWDSIHKSPIPGMADGWECTVQYGVYQRRAPLATGEHLTAFDTTGGTRHITQSLSTVGAYGPLGATTLAQDVTIGDTQIAVTNANSLPTAPFPISILGVGYSVTAVAGNVLTIDPAAKQSISKGGYLTAIYMLDNGSGYTDVPSVYFSGGGGTGAAAIAWLGSGGTVAAAITNGGSGYTDVPSVSINGPHTGGPAIGVAILAPPVVVVGAGNVPCFGGAIGVTRDSVEGCDIHFPAFQWEETWVFDLEDITDAYIRRLYQLTGTVCTHGFRLCDPYETLFLGVRGAQRGATDAELTFRFAGSVNRRDQWVNNILVPEIRGWDYAWIHYQDQSNGYALVKVPDSVFVEQVYRYEAWTDLNLGYNW